jgi:polysaccharide pyruvyl transferase WcaK-like protein
MPITRRAFLPSLAAPLLAQPQRRPHILFIGGWNLYNIGDVAIPLGFFRLRDQYFPEAKITLLIASYPKELGDYYRSFYPDLDIIPFEFKAGVPLSPQTEEAFRGADALVLGSGMTLSYGYYGLEYDRYIPRLLAFLKAKQMGIPFGVYAHSFDKLEPHAEYLYKEVLNQAAFIYTRDSESLKLIQSKGVSTRETAFAPDTTFGFDLHKRPEAKTLGEAFLREHKLEPGKFLSFIARLDVNRFRNDGREQHHAEQTRELIIRYVRATKETVAIVPEVERLLKDTKQMVYDQLPGDVKPLVRCSEKYWMPAEAQHVYTNSRMVVSAEMHSVILGLAAGTPSLHPYFAQAGLKQWMMRDLGLQQWLFDQDAVPLEKVSDAMLAVHKDTARARATVAKAMDFARKRQRETFAVLKRAAMGHIRSK